MKKLTKNMLTMEVLFKMKNYDFSGWATKNDLLCADGRIIKRDAFIDNDGETVPLVWNHQHGNAENVLGHALLKNTPDGVKAYCTFNNTESGKNAKLLVNHGDVTQLSIYANKLVQNGKNVVHGAIKEVSLVLAGANPGARIDYVMSHSMYSDEDGAIITTGEFLIHSDEEEEEEKKNDDVAEEEVAEEPSKSESEDEESEDKMNENEIKHAETEEKEKTVQDVIDSMTKEQQDVLYALVGNALQTAGNTNEDEKEGEGEDMKHNLFDNEENETDGILSHADTEAIFADANRYGSLKDAVLAHGITNIDWLFPEHKNINGNGAPGFIGIEPSAWVSTVMNGVHHTPFARVKMLFADIRPDDARAKGYQKGNLKTEEVFGLLRRTVDPTTVYKKQAIDRDDAVDITDFDVVAWIKGEMRTKLDEELARAILFGDGRSALSNDKIDESRIIPICSDAALYTIQKTVTPIGTETLPHAIIRSCVEAQDDYEGSGNTIFFTAPATITSMLLMEDANGIRLYKDMKDLALALNVEKIVKVPASMVPDGKYGVIVDLKDYNIGADKGGSVNMFDDFDIDYNKQKYLIETRCSGALTRPYSAISLNVASGETTEETPAEPSVG